MRALRLVGMDPSLRNWGIARGLWVPHTPMVIDHLGVTCAVLPKGKQVRVNSEDLESAKQLYDKALAACKDADAIFVEIPSGSQSSRASLGSGICIGIVGALRAQGLPIYEVSPDQVKLFSTNKLTASKAEMIKWGMAKHPEASWPMHNGKVSAAKAEHCADAVGAIYAGVHTNEFQQLLPIILKAA